MRSPTRWLPTASSAEPPPATYQRYGATFDLRGHGRSAAQRGYIASWDDYRQDLRDLARFVQERTPGLPLFLLGHSLGGVIVLNYAIRYPEGLRGVVAISPALGEVGIAPAKRALCADEVTADLQRWLEAHLD